ncbi:hypothetical protein ACH5RR_007084 [Cinchona calisaya]|uniref:rRNA N-glycosidase n=1 Tax=Cinchona calisaya TaxID=153742 RepID=A0ABD3AQW5_9GENT
MDSKLVCQLCNKVGHAAPACHSRDDFLKSFSAMTRTNPSDSNQYPDSGATAHMTPNEGNLSSKASYIGCDKIVIGNVNFNSTHFHVKDNQTRNTLLSTRFSGGLYPISSSPISSSPKALVALAISAKVLHSRSGLAWSGTQVDLFWRNTMAGNSNTVLFYGIPPSTDHKKEWKVVDDLLMQVESLTFFFPYIDDYGGSALYIPYRTSALSGR